ncbi:MAG: MarR family transcriptional regulator [Bacteroidota bacterium]
MKIEEVIHQSKPFGSNFEKAIVNLIFTSNWLLAKQNAFFSKYEITTKQYNILRILRGAQKPISTLEIKNRMLDRNSDVSRIVDRLFKKELVDKSPCKNDQRKVDIVLNKNSALLLKSIDAEIEKWQNEFTSLDKTEASMLSDLLDKMRK